jgi:hypothetical protein
VVGLLASKTETAFAQSDTTPPTTTATLNGTVGLNDWYTSGVGVNLSASDLESGVASINYRLDEGEWQREEFLGTLNRIQNPSFEDGDFFWIDKWNHPYYPLWRALLYQSWEAKFGSKSAAILIFSSGNYYWHNRSHYAVVEPAKIYTASVWVKTAVLVGDGASLSVWAIKSSGPDELLVESQKISGNNDWTRLALTFSPPVDSQGVYLRLSASGRWGFVFWDGASLVEEGETGVSFTVGTSGQHNLEFDSVDHAGNEETPHQTVNLKIDTSAPGGWQNFEAVETLNNHTFQCRIDVSDTVSGLDVSEAAYQYTYDGGQTWSNWLTDVTVSPNIDGSATVQLTTGDVDFHDSNWQVGKVIRFRIADLAGLQGVSPDQNLFGAWMKTTGGDVYANGNISMSTSGPEPSAEGLIQVSGSSISNFSSVNNWEIKMYPSLTKLSYAEWQEKFPTTTPLPQGKLPLFNGRYFAGDGDFVVDSQTIPDGLSTTENLAAVVFVGGNLIIRTDLTVRPSSVILFIVGGDVRIAKSVEKVSASFLLDGNFDTSYDGAPPQKQLVVEGLVVAEKLILRRSLSGQDNLTTPAEVFVYPGQIINLSPYLGEGAMGWREIR